MTDLFGFFRYVTPVKSVEKINLDICCDLIHSKDYNVIIIT